MSLKNVDLGSLRNAIRMCDSKIRMNKISDIESQLKDSNSWDASCKKNLFNALEKLTTYHLELKEKLRHYEKVVDYFARYQQLDSHAKSCEQEAGTLLSKDDQSSIDRMVELRKKMNDIANEQASLLSKIMQLL